MQVVILHLEHARQKKIPSEFILFFRNLKHCQAFENEKSQEILLTVRLHISTQIIFILIELLSFLTKHYLSQPEIRTEYVFLQKNVFDKVPQKTSTHCK